MRHVALGVVAVCVLATVAVAMGPQMAQQGAVESAQAYVAREGVRGLGLRAGEQLLARSVSDDGVGVQHVRFDSFAGGVRVFGGEVIVHVGPNGKTLGVTNQHRNVFGDSRPTVAPDEAIGIAWSEMKPSAAPAVEPTAELVFFPVGSGHTLAWLVDMFVENEVDDPMARIFVIDAHDRRDDHLLGQPADRYTPGTGTAKVGTAKPLYLVASPGNPAAQHRAVHRRQVRHGRPGLLQLLHHRHAQQEVRDRHAVRRRGQRVGELPQHRPRHRRHRRPPGHDVHHGLLQERPRAQRDLQRQQGCLLQGPLRPLLQQRVLVGGVQVHDLRRRRRYRRSPRSSRSTWRRTRCRTASARRPRTSRTPASRAASTSPTPTSSARRSSSTSTPPRMSPTGGSAR